MINFKLSEMRKAGLLESARKMFTPHVGHWQTSLQSSIDAYHGPAVFKLGAPASMTVWLIKPGVTWAGRGGP